MTRALRTNLPVTKKQFQLLTMIHEYRQAHGFAPTQAELAAMRGVTKVTVHEAVHALQVAGLVKIVRHHARKLELTEKCFVSDSLVLAGGVPAQAGCLTCGEFSMAPYLQVGEPFEDRDDFGAFTGRKCVLDCPHCERKSEWIQKRYH